jgi:predicted Zn-dependent protease
MNPNGMIQLFEQLEKEHDVYIPKIISSHPLTAERKKNMQKIISTTKYDVKNNEKLNAIFEHIKE